MEHKPIPWTQSTGMVGAYVSQALGLLAAIAAALLPFAEELPRGLVIACVVVMAVAGVGGVGVGVASARKRRAKGADPTKPQPPIEGGSPVPPVVFALLAAGATLALVTSCAPAWQAGGYGVATGGQACEPAHAECRAACQRDLDDPWQREAALIACDCGVRYCDLGRRWAAHEIARKAAEAAAREAAQPAPSEP